MSREEMEELELANYMDGWWFVRAVSRLRRFNHSLQEIGDYTLEQFSMHLAATEQIESRERLQTIADLQVVVASALTTESGLEDQMTELRLAARGA